MEKITRTATVIAVKNGQAVLRIHCAEACQGCAARNLCGSSGGKNMEIVACLPPDTKIAVGEKVKITLDSSQGLQAGLFAYVVPLLLLVMTITLLKICGFGDFSSGISGIIILIPYYFGLFLTHRKRKPGRLPVISKKDQASGECETNE